MSVSVSATIERPALGNTDTVTAAIFNASGVVSVTGVVSGAVASDGSTPITGDLSVAGTLTVGKLKTGAISTASTVATGSLQVGAAGSALAAVRTGVVSLSVPAGAAGSSVSVSGTFPGATAAGTRLYFPNGVNAYVVVRSATVSAGDSVALSLVRVAAMGATTSIPFAYLHLA